jgi:hypothetical protein
MTTKVEPLQVEQIACEICLKEVPRSEAVVSEATDYVAYFCGLDCYGKWKDEGDKTADQGSRPSPGR